MRKILLLICSAILWNACNIINPKEPIPTYVNIDTFSFTNPDASFTGTSSQLISAAFLYADDQIVGTFDLPCTVPVLTTKDARLTIMPAVYNQGFKSYVFVYPFFLADTTHTLLYNPGTIQKVQPQTRYHPRFDATNFKYMDNFESGLRFKYLAGDGEMVLENAPEKVFEGKHVGALYLNQEVKTIEAVATESFPLQTGRCFLEINYKCSIPFAVGVECENTSGTTYGEYLAGFNTKEQWNKMYIEVGSFLQANAAYSKFYIKFKASLEMDNVSAQEGYVLIDNIKIVAL